MKYAGVGVGALAAGAAGYFLREELDRLQQSSTRRIATTSQTSALDTTPPVIQDLRWQPTRVVNNRVYDGSISFAVEDQDSSIAEAYLDFQPVYPTHIPREAFPEEPTRQYTFTGAGKTENFSQTITDLKGGKEYRARVGARDKAGNRAGGSIDIPYIREFENIAPSSMGVVTAYYVFYHLRTDDVPNWSDGHKYTPKLGEYLSDDEVVIRRHADCMSGYGIRNLLVSWGAPEDWVSKRGGHIKKHHQVLDENLQALIDNSLLTESDLEVGILYETPGRLLPTNPKIQWERNLTPRNTEILKSDFAYLAEKYFNHPNFWRIDGKPVVYIYDTPAMTGDLRAAVQAIRQAVRRAGSDEVFLITDFAKAHREVFPSRNTEWAALASLFDAVTSWLGGYMPDGNYLGGSYEKQIELIYGEWFRWCKAKDIPLIPYVTPEFDARLVSWGDPAEIPLPRSPDLFRERVKIAMKYSGLAGTIAVGSWNDFFESHALEPSREYGFTYLDIVRDCVTKLSA